MLYNKEVYVSFGELKLILSSTFIILLCGVVMNVLYLFKHYLF